MSEDWLDTEERPQLPVPAVAELPTDPGARLALAEECWARLSPQQHMFLTAFRSNGLNARKTARQLEGRVSREAHIGWMHQRDYMTVVRLWQGYAASDALDKDRLLARQDDIVETLMTPKPILHQGTPTGFEEVEAGAASRANEVLMKAAGLLKDKELDVNVGLVGPTLMIQVVQPDSTVVDITPRGVPVALPEPAKDGDWIDGV